MILKRGPESLADRFSNSVLNELISGRAQRADDNAFAGIAVYSHAPSKKPLTGSPLQVLVMRANSSLDSFCLDYTPILNSDHSIDLSALASHEDEKRREIFYKETDLGFGQQLEFWLPGRLAHELLVTVSTKFGASSYCPTYWSYTLGSSLTAVRSSGRRP